jgi:hypothetical protein
MSSSQLLAPQDPTLKDLGGYAVEHLRLPISQTSFKPVQVDLLITEFMLQQQCSFHCQHFFFGDKKIKRNNKE